MRVERSQAQRSRDLLRLRLEGDGERHETPRTFAVVDMGGHLNVATILRGESAAGSNLGLAQVRALRDACNRWLEGKDERAA